MGKDWGATKTIAKQPAASAPARAESAPVLSRASKPSREVGIEDLDGSKWTFGELKKGTADYYFPADYNGGRLVFKLNKLSVGGDDLVRAPFAAGPYKEPSTGALLGDANKWTMQLELSESKQRILQKELVEPMIAHAKAHSKEAFPAQTRMRGGKEEVTKPGYTPEDVERNFESPIKEPKDEKYRPTLRVNINANPDEPNRHPNVQVAEFRGTSISKRQPGSLATLQQPNCVGTWSSAVVRGIWVNRGTGKCGVSLSLEGHLNLSNMSGAPSKEAELDGFQEDDDVAGAPAPLPAPPPSQWDDEAAAAGNGLGGYDAGGLADEGVPEDADA
jgi:hypothetical protein